MAYKIAVTTGLHYIGRSEELASITKKLGFGMTRGTRAVEIALDVPHEITETDGVEVRKMAEKQGVDVLMHGSLTIPMDIPERSDYRDAQDHIRKSIRSSVRAGAKYVDFHASLNIWLELMTYSSRKMTMSFCDHEGRFISSMLKKSPALRKWFIDERGELYAGDVMTPKERIEFRSQIGIKFDDWLNDDITRKLKDAGYPEQVIDHALSYHRFPELPPNMKEQEVRGREIIQEINRKSLEMRSNIEKEQMEKLLDEKLARGDAWDSEELRTQIGVIDGYHIMAHFMFYEKDPMWVEMARLYPRLSSVYGMNYSDRMWLHNAWRKAEEDNDRDFKEFFYGVVAAKYLEGHMKRTLEWIDKELIPKELAGSPKLQQIARDLKIAIESPDARDPQHAGLHTLWRTKQIYTAIKVIRQQLKTDTVWMLADFEHVATQGVDPVKEWEDELLKIAPDIGAYCLSIHANAPSPAHSHEPLELGDIRVYKFLYYLWKTGFGKKRDVYVVYERGGGEDPFRRSVEALRLMVHFMEKGVPPDQLPPEFFGYKGAVAGDETRQMQIIRDHAYEPLKDLLEMPDEEFGMLSSNVLRKGKRPEQWKKAEYR